MKDIRLQIQAVLYNNSIDSIKKSILSLENAVLVAQKNSIPITETVLKYGDASPTSTVNTQVLRDLLSKNEDSGSLRIDYTYFGFNSGYGKGHNLLSEKSQSDYLVLMNPDIIVTPRFFIEMLTPFADSSVGLVEARQTPVEHQKEYDIFTKETDWATGACFMVRRGLFAKLAGFDDKSFFMYCEDIDFSWRLRLLGYKIIYQPLAPVFHDKHISLEGKWQPTSTEKYYSSESHLLMAYKWSNPKLLSELIYNYENSDDVEYQRAVESFLKRRKAGLLPKQLDSEHKISNFSDGYYSANRFLL